ncbi:hypothetical protein [Streptomyces platensis]|uniref:hypothetical protein n=1 Tax=Streptomyces platensis TaxID=58346 RepID=UPI001F23AA16|nr:hypothetical protein [Streptomyces platensis]MCF3142195.1 hypothetical protein [Streptomyces platensis]
MIVAVGDPVWTPERADQFVREVSPKGRRLLHAVAEGEGRVDCEKFREQYGESALHGPSAAITKAVNRGIREGWLPEGTELPLTSTYDGRSSWSKTDGYRLPRHLAVIFCDAFRRIYPAPGNPQVVKDHLTALYVELGHHEQAAREMAEDFLETHADDLAIWLHARVRPWRPGDTSSQVPTEHHLPTNTGQVNRT